MDIRSPLLWVNSKEHYALLNGQNVYFTKKLLNCLPKWLHCFEFPAAVNESFCGFTPSPAFSAVRGLCFGYFSSLGRNLTVVLICISLMTCDVEYLFIWLLAMCISFLVKYVLWPLALLKVRFVFVLLNF